MMSLGAKATTPQRSFIKIFYRFLLHLQEPLAKTENGSQRSFSNPIEWYMSLPITFYGPDSLPL